VEAAEVGASSDYWFGIAWAQRVLARVAYLGADVAAATSPLAVALEVFTRVGAAFEVGRTHLAVAELAHGQGDRARADRSLADAPRYHERLRALAKSW
jgi:hypothetical protein